VRERGGGGIGKILLQTKTKHSIKGAKMGRREGKKKGRKK